MQLNLFNGGLSTRLSPHLLQVNEAIEYVNIDSSKGSLTPLKANTDENTVVASSIYYFKNRWVTSKEDRDYVEFNNVLYHTSSTKYPKKSTDGSTWNYIGIVGPRVPPLVIAATGPDPLNDSTYQYCYTYYNENTGTESVPSKFSNEISTISQYIKVTVQKSTDPQTTHIKLYRLGSNKTVMSLVTTLDNLTAEYNDTLSDSQIDGAVLDSYYNYPPPVGMLYLTESNAMLFGAVNNKLYYSDVAYPEYWSNTNYIEFNRIITGIGKVSSGLIVFTENETYIITGTSPATLSKYLLSAAQGCLLHKSISYVSNSLIWLSKDGICATAGGEITVVSADKLGKLSLNGPIASVVSDDVYYLALACGTLYVDFKYGSIVFGVLSTNMEGMHVSNDIFYFSAYGKLYSFCTSSENTELSYKSATFSDGGLSSRKTYRTIYVSSLGSIAFRVYIDNTKVYDRDLVDGVTEIKTGDFKKQGYSIRFEAEGSGTITEIEYKIEGRQNGR